MTAEAARHPFRRSLPPHALRGSVPEGEPKRRSIELRDCRDFLAAYCATFVAVMIFIS